MKKIGNDLCIQFGSLTFFCWRFDVLRNNFGLFRSVPLSLYISRINLTEIRTVEPVETWKFWAKVGNLLLAIKMNLTQNDSQVDYYENFFELRPSLIFMATISVLVTPVVVGLFYFTIWYEINGSDSRRNLINRLVSPLSWLCIIYLLVPQTTDLVRYFYGPLPDIVCAFNIYLKNVLIIAGQFFYIFILVSR